LWITVQEVLPLKRYYHMHLCALVVTVMILFGYPIMYWLFPKFILSIG